MKRIPAIILAAIMLLPLASCGKVEKTVSSPAPTGEASAPSSVPAAVPTGEASAPSPVPTAVPTAEANEDLFIVDYSSSAATGAMQPIFETDTTVYFLTQTWMTLTYMIYVSDKEYHDWMPLCSRPDCMHNNRDCNAWLEGFPNQTMWLYGDHIYYVTDTSVGLSDTTDEDEYPELWRMRLDGSEHERLLKIDLSETYKKMYGSGGSHFGYSISWFFHNRFAFVTMGYDTGDIDDDPRFIGVHTYYVDLSEDKPEARKLELTDENGDPSRIFTVIAGKDEFLYSLDYMTNKLYSTNIVTGEHRALCELSFEPPASLTGCSYEDGMLYFCSGFDAGFIYTVNADTGDISEINEAEPQAELWDNVCGGLIFGAGSDWQSDPEEIERYREMGIEITPLKDPERRFCTDFYDLSGKLIAHIPHEAYGDLRIHIGWMIGDYVFGYELEDGYVHKNELPEWYLDLSELGTDAFGWKKWEP